MSDAPEEQEEYRTPLDQALHLARQVDNLDEALAIELAKTYAHIALVDVLERLGMVLNQLTAPAQPKPPKDEGVWPSYDH